MSFMNIHTEKYFMNFIENKKTNLDINWPIPIDLAPTEFRLELNQSTSVIKHITLSEQRNVLRILERVGYVWALDISAPDIWAPGLSGARTFFF